MRYNWKHIEQRRNEMMLAGVTFQCDGCGWKGNASDLGWIEDMNERVTDTVPAGECPFCDSLVYKEVWDISIAELEWAASLLRYRRKKGWV